MLEATRIPWIDEYALARECPMLFHYTCATKLPLILKSGGLIATKYTDTNDPNELHALRSPLVSLMTTAALPLLKYAKEIGHLTPPEDWNLLSATRHDAINFHDIMVRALPSAPHITCFSTHSEDHQLQNGLLTMWRLYGGNSGIALGFDTSKIVERSDEIQKSMAVGAIYPDRVLYGLDARLVKRIIESPDVIQKFAENIMLMLRRKTEPLDFENSTLGRFIVLICCAKHADFSDEREIRLIVQPALEGDERERLTEHSTGRLIVKYLDALRCVMVGPSEHQDSIANGVRDQLDAAGYQHVEILRSGTQFTFV